MSPSPTQILRLPSADASAGERFERLARQLSAQAHDESQPVTARLAFLREAERFETLSALYDADAILAAHAHEVA
ncbi:MAG: hypothetical protein BroJett013_06930 [Alphaproteobacteria bacterium]|nr:MAG: hypothetical protein BroJett013_06930 [Alphaproteobacteria bacterium]